jgi:hypothetical protein
MLELPSEPGAVLTDYLTGRAAREVKALAPAVGRGRLLRPTNQGTTARCVCAIALTQYPRFDQELESGLRASHRERRSSPLVEGDDRA